MPEPSLRCFIVTLVWGEGAQIISTVPWVAPDPATASALAVNAVLRQNPQLPTLIGHTVTEVPAAFVEEAARVLRGEASPGPLPLALVKPEGSA